MVALKHLLLPRLSGHLRRSRNAVVALKLTLPRLPPAGGGAKQERRGGIETTPVWVCQASIST